MSKFFICFQFQLLLFSFVFITSCTGQEKTNAQEDPAIESKTVRSDTIVKENQSSKQNYEFSSLPITSNLDALVSEFIRTTYQDKNGNIWFGTNGDGVIHYNGDFLEKFTKKQGFGGTAVREIVADKEGNIWFGTSGGLTKHTPSAELTTGSRSFTNFSQKGDQINNEIWSLAIDRNGMIWVGTVAGVSRFDGKVFTPFPIPKAAIQNPKPILSHYRISKIIEDKNGVLWFATDGYGICKYDPSASDGKKFSHITTKDGLPDNNVADLLEDKNGNIWIGTMYGGVSLYDGTSFTNFTKNGIISGIEVYNFCEDKNGNIWFSAENFGVYRYDGKSFTNFRKKDGLATNGVQSIFEDKKGRLWFSTWSGLTGYDGKSFFSVTEKEPWSE